MTSEAAPGAAQSANVGLSRTLGLWTAVAVGCLATVGLGVFFLMGPVFETAGDQTPSVYIICFLYLVLAALTLAERWVGSRGQAGLYSLSPGTRSIAVSYSTGWVLLAGAVALVALYAAIAGAGIQLGLAGLVEEPSFLADGPWLILIIIVLVAANQITGAMANWGRRSFAIYGAITLVLTVLLLARWRELPAPQAIYYLPSASILSALPVVVVAGWGLQFVIERGGIVRSPQKSVWRVMLISIGIMALLGVLIGSFFAGHPNLLNQVESPLASLAGSISPVLEILVLVAMVGLGLIGCDTSMRSVRRLAGDMNDDGFLPGALLQVKSRWDRPFYPIGVTALLAMALSLWASLASILAMSAAGFLIPLALVNAQDLFRRKPRLPENRPLRLPFHPLIPAITAAAAIMFFSLIDFVQLLPLLPWLIAGLLVYLGYARRSAVETRRQETLFTPAATTLETAQVRVLVGVVDPRSALPLLRLGARIAKVRQAQLLVVRVIEMAYDVPSEDRRRAAAEAWGQLNELTADLRELGVDAAPLVRLAPTAAEGILSTMWEENIDDLVLGWPANPTGGDTVRRIVGEVKKEVIILHGEWPDQTQRLLVPIISRAHSQAALNLAADLAGEAESVEALQVVPLKSQEDDLRLARDELGNLLSNLDHPERVATRVLPARNAEAGVTAAIQSAQGMILGLSDEGFLAQTDFGGLPSRLAEAVETPALLVKRDESTGSFLARRSWEQLSAALPTLTRARQSSVLGDMRRDARANIDFYVLIVLATAIAFLGLLQNSSAVIIGAMLVAPLMSPMLAMSSAIVTGNLIMLRRAFDSTVNGILVAVAVAMFLTMGLLILGMPIQNTAEILARTQPNLLDLLVALASGAAAAYAISRAEVAAALPGVAISAALVPPLAVVGYGLGTAQFEFSLGALLLFLTNLAAIVLAATLVFLLLGFRPPVRAERSEQARRGLFVSVASLVLISVPLLLTTVVSNAQGQREAIVRNTLESAWPPVVAQVIDVEIKSDGRNEMEVESTVFDYEGRVTRQEVAQLQQELTESVGVPVSLTARIVDARLDEFNNSSARLALTETPTPAPLPTDTPRSDRAADEPTPQAAGTPQP